MDGSTTGSIFESRIGEEDARLQAASPRVIWSIHAIDSRLGPSGRKVLSRLIDAFSIPDSGIGLVALARELQIDLATMRKGLPVPPWTADLQELLAAIVAVPGADPARDLASLRSQPRCPLRDFLAPWKPGLVTAQQRGLRAIRAIVAMRLISTNERLTAPAAAELARALQGRGTAVSGIEDVTAERLVEQRGRLQPESPQARLITHVIETLQSPLPTPFAAATPAPIALVGLKSSLTAQPSPDRVTRSSSTAGDPDPLRGFKAAAGIAGCRVFSGVPDLWQYLHAFELEAVIPRIVHFWRGGGADEALAAFVTLFTRAMPSTFSRIPLSVGEGAGLWINPEEGCVVWNLDEIVASHNSDNPFIRTPNDRYVRIPVPLEIADEIRQRKHDRLHAQTVADLFPDIDELDKRTKSVLRRLALTSHRPTLTRLAASWGRYVLSRCADEGYASAIGIDFTLGTTANLNYLRLRGGRIRSILSTCYAGIGLSGQCADVPISDVGSLRLPSSTDAADFVRTALTDIHDAITKLPRHCTIDRLRASHNSVAIAFYSFFKFITAGRSLREETVTRSRLDLSGGYITLTDKRVAPYHERRPGYLPPTARTWLQTYLSWLHLVAYRLGAVAPSVAQAIRSVADGADTHDRHPLFFRFLPKDGNTAPTGAADIAPLLESFSLEPNAGRHFVDALFRDAGIDSAAIMAWAGRGNPGQEAYGSGSAVVPQKLLAHCASVIEDWLGTLGLPTPPELTPRRLVAAALDARTPVYVPELLTERPASVLLLQGAEPCPFRDDAVAHSGCYVGLLRAWRSKAPPAGWEGVALSLMLEDGVFLEHEIESALTDFEHGVLYRHDKHVFIDVRCRALGLRRIWLSAVTVRLLYRIPTSEAIFRGMRAVAAAASELIRDAGGPETRAPVRFVVDCVRSYFALHTPGILFAWMSGVKFSRTARPEVIAREMLGCCEHPKFDVRAKARGRRSADEMSKELRIAAAAVNAGKSHRTALMRLAESLDHIRTFSDPESEEDLLIGYCRHLATTQQNIFTVERYVSACRTFLTDVATSAAQDGFSNVDWRALVSKSLGDGNDGEASSPTAAAINHCFEWLGIDIRVGRHSGPPPSAFQYADRLTAREADSACSMLATRRQYPGDDWHRAEVALRLMLDHALRWDEIASLRMCDVSLDTDVPHLVITYESGARLKSNNAPRALRLASHEAVNALRSLCEVRKAQYPCDDLVPIFGDDRDTRENRASDRIHNLISEALWRATGSALISPHSTRHTVITRGLHEILDASRQEQQRPLQLRQALFGLSARAAHGHFDVTVGEYAVDLDRARRVWTDEIQSKADCTRKPAFLEGVTGIPAATYRKRASRDPLNCTPDCYEGFHSDVPEHIGLTTRKLSALVEPDLTALEWPDEQVQEDRLTAAAFYLGLRMLGESDEAAALAARLQPSEANCLERSLGSLQRLRGISMSGRQEISRERFAEAVWKSRLPVALSSLSTSPQTLRILSGAVRKFGAPWEFVDFEDALELGPFIPALAAAGITAQVVLRSTDRSALDDLRISRIVEAGLPHVRLLPPRHFPRNVQSLVRFIPALGECATKPRASPLLSFLVSAAVVALHIVQEQLYVKPSV